jgi:predicted TIM-barrel fold metal-dependent hydrolase
MVGMELPSGSPVAIIDSFSQLTLDTDGIEVPIPRAALRDSESLSAWPSTDIVGHLFKKDAGRQLRDQIMGDLDLWIENLDRWSIGRAQVPLNFETPDATFDRLSEHADRIFVSLRVDPHDGMTAVRRIGDLARRYPILKSVMIVPHMLYPHIAPNSREYYPIYSACIENDLAIMLNVGFPGPRVPAWTQNPMHVDEVCWFFPELRVIFKHGGEPWTDTCVKMMQTWPNVYYATSGFAPKYYPKSVLDYANTRGSDKVIFAGYWPMLSYDRIFAEAGELALRDEVWPKFLSSNAERAFGLTNNS